MIEVNRILTGDAVQRLRDIPARSIDTVITSPPYYRLRNYQVAGQLGDEDTIDRWVSNVLAVLDGVARVLKPTGSVWLNVGDSYARHHSAGAPPKSLLLGPERLLLALSERGWIVRNRVAWVKTNPMPGSVRDRLNTVWEPVYLLVRDRKYFFDLDAGRIPHRSPAKVSKSARARAALPRTVPPWAGPLAGSQHGLDRMKAAGFQGHPLGKNPGDIVMTPTSNYRGAHFATFPLQLVMPLLRMTGPERVCSECGSPWQRAAIDRQVGHLAALGELRPSCGCGRQFVPGLVLDPFMGAGTVAIAAERLQRLWLGIELNPAFVALAGQRLNQERGRCQAAA